MPSRTQTRPRRRWRAALAATCLATSVALLPSGAAAADGDNSPFATQTVLAWNQALMNSVRPLGGPGPFRTAAIVQAAVFDAVNGITHRYRPFHDTDPAPRDAAPAAAVAGAAYQALRVLLPSQTATFAGLLTQTVPRQDKASVRGLAWGESVADTILAGRADDGFLATPAPYTPTAEPGRWQPTPPAFIGPASRQLMSATPFVLSSPSQFRPGPPPALSSTRYATDYAEVKAYGSRDSPVRSPNGTETATLRAADGPADLWDTVADTLIAARRLGPTDAARVLAQTDLAMADAAVAVWEAKNYYDTWRPITAIHDAASDGNPATAPDPTWEPLLNTPPFQEYPSGHAGISSAAAAVLAHRFGNDTGIAIATPNMPGVVHAFPSFAAAVAEVTDARIDAGFHFRFSCDTADLMGNHIATYITATTMQPREGDDG
jgi:hypothetical protein